MSKSFFAQGQILLTDVTFFPIRESDGAVAQEKDAALGVFSGRHIGMDGIHWRSKPVAMAFTDRPVRLSILSRTRRAFSRRRAMAAAAAGS